MSATTQVALIRVWDPVVRYGHWALVAAFAVAYLSADDEGPGAAQWHAWSGYVVGAIVSIRLIWGFVGTPHARFSDFAHGPAAASRYLVDLPAGVLLAAPLTLVVMAAVELLYVEQALGEAPLEPVRPAAAHRASRLLRQSP